MSAHDVRTLHACVVCGDIGTVANDLPDIPTVLVLKVDKRKKPVATAHPRCLNQDGVSVDNILRLPQAQIGRVRLSDVSPAQMQLIMDAPEKIEDGDKVGYEHSFRSRPGGE